MKRKEIIGLATFWTSLGLTALIYIFGRLVPYFEMVTSIWGVFILMCLISHSIYEHIL